MNKPQRSTPPSWVSYSYFLTAFGWLSVFCLGLPWIGRIFGTDQFYMGPVIGWVHVLTIGVLTQILLGAWYHLMIMISGSPAPGAGRMFFHYLGLNGGLVWFLGSWLTGEITWNLTLAATVLTLVFTDVGIVSLRRLAGTDRSEPYGKFIGTGFVSFILLGWLGFLMAHNKWLGFMEFTGFMTWIETHALIGVGGWFGMMAIGISFRLIPLFNDQEASANQSFNTVYFSLLAGITAWIIGVWTGGSTVRTIGQLLIVLGMGSWFIWIVRIWLRSTTHETGADFVWILFGITHGLSGLFILIIGQEIPRLLAGGLFVFMSVLSFELGILHRILPFLRQLMLNPLSVQNPKNVSPTNTVNGFSGLFTGSTHAGIGIVPLAIVLDWSTLVMVGAGGFSVGILATIFLLTRDFLAHG